MRLQAEVWERQAGQLSQQSSMLERQAAALAGPSEFAKSTKLRRRAVAVAKQAETLELSKVGQIRGEGPQGLGDRLAQVCDLY